MMKSEPVAKLFHEISKYDPEGIKKSTEPLDWSKQPKSIKVVNTQERVSLVPFLPFSQSPFDGENIQHHDLDMQSILGRLSRVLYFTYGATGFAKSQEDLIYFRSSPSAGGLYPAEINVAVRMVEGLEDGIYHYEVQDHALAKVWEGDYWSTIEHACFGHSSLQDSQIVIFVSSVFERGTWRYKDRALRRIFLDIGHMLGNLFLVSRIEGFQSYQLAGFLDNALNEMLLFEESKESVMMTVPLVKQRAAGELHDTYWAHASNGKDTGVEPCYQRFHEVSKIIDGDQLEMQTIKPLDVKEDYRGYPIEMPHDSMSLSGQLYDTIARRRSARHFTKNVFSFKQLAMLLNFSYGKTDDIRLNHEMPDLIFPDILKTYIAVNQVEGLENGLYQYDSEAGDLYVMRRGDFSDQIRYLSLGQELASDAAFVVFHFANLDEVIERAGDRGYRYIKFDAGQIGQRLNLASVALGLGASGIGGYFDDMANEIFVLGKELSLLYITCVGTVQ